MASTGTIADRGWPNSDEAAERMAPFATRHELYNGTHNHTQVGDPDWSFERLLSHSPYNALNLDVGHYAKGHWRVLVNGANYFKGSDGFFACV